MAGLEMGTTVALAALLVSVISLAISSYLAQRSDRNTTYRSATDLVLDIDKIFVASPELRRFFYDGVGVAGQRAQTRQQVAAISEFMLDCFECIWDIRRTYSKDDRQSWGRFVIDMLDSSPALAQMYEQRGRAWYPALADLKEAERKGELDLSTREPGPEVERPRGVDRALVRLEEAPAPLVWSFYDTLLAPQFPPDELEPFESLAAALGKGTGGVLALEDGHVVGGVVDESYESAGVQLISYLSVDPRARGRGLGAQLVTASVEASRHPLVVGEIEDPRHWPTTETSDPVARVRFWKRVGCRVLPFPYFQPRLGPQGHRVGHLLLVVLPPAGGDPRETVAGPDIAAFLREYFTTAEGSEPDDEEFHHLIERCSSGSLRLWSLDDLDSAVPLT